MAAVNASMKLLKLNSTICWRQVRCLRRVRTPKSSVPVPPIDSPSASSSGAPITERTKEPTPTASWRRHLMKNMDFIDTSADVDARFLANRRKVELEPNHLRPVKATEKDIRSAQAPVAAKSTVLAPYVNTNYTLQNLVNLGVDLYAIDQLVQPDLANYILGRDFKRDVQPIIESLVTDTHLSLEQLGNYITRNPWILQQTPKKIRQHAQYLESKLFTPESIATIVFGARYWLNMPVEVIDSRLGWLQQQFDLSGDQVRSVMVKFPKLLMFGIGYFQNMIFCMHEELGFNTEHMQLMLLESPEVWLSPRGPLQKSFDFLHTTLGHSHDMIALNSVCLRANVHTLRTRHEFLKSIGRAQYNPERPNYVRLQYLAVGTDRQFAENVAKCPVNAYNQFLLSM